MKKYLFVMMSAFLLTLVGSLPSSAKKIVVTKFVNVDKTCDMRYLVGTCGQLMGELGTRYWFWNCGTKIYCHDMQSNHHWVFFFDGTGTIIQAEPFHYVGQDFDPSTAGEWPVLTMEDIESMDVLPPLPSTPCEDEIVIDYGKDYYPFKAVEASRFTYSSKLLYK